MLKKKLCNRSIWEGNDLFGENWLQQIHASSRLSGLEGRLISWKGTGHQANNVTKFAETYFPWALYELSHAQILRGTLKKLP